MERQQNMKKGVRSADKFTTKRTRVVTTNHDQGQYSRKRSSGKKVMIMCMK